MVGVRKIMENLSLYFDNSQSDKKISSYVRFCLILTVARRLQVIDCSAIHVVSLTTFNQHLTQNLKLTLNLPLCQLTTSLSLHNIHDIV